MVVNRGNHDVTRSKFHEDIDVIDASRRARRASRMGAHSDSHAGHDRPDPPLACARRYPFGTVVGPPWMRRDTHREIHVGRSPHGSRFLPGIVITLSGFY